MRKTDNLLHPSYFTLHTSPFILHPSFTLSSSNVEIDGLNGNTKTVIYISVLGDD
jgi:hypothetical protein